MTDFDRRVRDLDVATGATPAGRLSRRSQYEFDYLAAAQTPISLVMPVATPTFRTASSSR